MLQCYPKELRSFHEFQLQNKICFHHHDKKRLFIIIFNQKAFKKMVVPTQKIRITLEQKGK